MDLTELGYGFQLGYFGSGKGAVEWGSGGGGVCLDILQLYNFFPTPCMYAFRKPVTTNSHYFHYSINRLIYELETRLCLLRQDMCLYEHIEDFHYTTLRRRRTSLSVRRDIISKPCIISVVLMLATDLFYSLKQGRR